MSSVRYCEKMRADVYRVGVCIDLAGLVDVPDDDSISIGIGPAIPAGAYLNCPSCGKHADFHLVGCQMVGADTMPLYNCAACGTTRSIVGLLSHSRRQVV